MTTKLDSTHHEVIQLLTTFVGGGEPVKSTHHLMRDLELDSVKVMELMMVLEDNFDISIPLNVLPNVETVSDLSEQIIKLKQQN